MGATRRAFLERLGAVGGFSAAYLGMEALGLLNAPPAAAEPFQLPPAPGRGRRVVILGAGISGLVSAYELKRAGWDVTVLEARNRIGGRSWTVRGGDRIVQTGRPNQICGFSQGLYLNTGPARDPLPGGYRETGRPIAAMCLQDVLALGRAVALPLLFEDIFDMQAPMFQPVGGMDRIAHALHERVRSAVRLNSPVTAIRRRDAGVRILYGPGDRALDADYCICTLPLNLLGRIPSDFSAAKRAAIRDNGAYLASTKVGFESPRFWEEGGIYGGLAWTDRPNENLFYPSGGWLSGKGVLVTAYSSGWTGPSHAAEFAAMSHDERFRVCRESVEALHPGKGHLLARPATVSWSLTPWSEGVGPIGPAFGNRPAGGPRTAAHEELLRPEGPVVFAGEHLSYVPFWQEGAALSAHSAMRVPGGAGGVARGLSARRSAAALRRRAMGNDRMAAHELRGP